MDTNTTRLSQKELELRFFPTLDNAQAATIGARQIAAALLETVNGKTVEGRDAFLSAVELATGEACTNSVKYHPVKGTDVPYVSVIFTLDESKLAISVSDGNDAFTLPAKSPDFDTVPDHGYGIYVMKEVMDGVVYRRENGRNIITMEKNILLAEVGP
jgi:serine/threonine-protein kinase RsbW